MSRLFIFGIGGSGSRVIRAFSMLTACGEPQFNLADEIVPLIIDHDSNNVDLFRTVNCLETYHKINKCIFPDDIDLNPRFADAFFNTPIKEMNEYQGGTSSFELHIPSDDYDHNLANIIGFTSLTHDDQPTQDLLKSLFGEDRHADIYTDLLAGLRGNPSVGSVVYTGITQTEEFLNILHFYNPDAGDKVMVIGSLFGGSAPSLIPEIVNAIRSDVRFGDRVRIGVVMILPYFSFVQEAGSDTLVGDLFDAKTRAVLKYYDDTRLNEKINSIYYVGDKERSLVNYSLGGSRQVSGNHIINLIGALSILHFADNVSDLRGKCHVYRMRNTDHEQAPGFTLLNFFSEDITKYIKPLVIMAFAVKFFKQEICLGTRAVINMTYYRAFRLDSYFYDGRLQRLPLTVPSNVDNVHATLYYFQTFCDEFIKWIDEMKDTGAHCLNLFDFNGALSATVEGCKLIKMKRFLFGNQRETDLVDAMTISEQIQKYFRKHYSDAAPVGHPMHFKALTPGFALLDCLKKGIEDALRDPEISAILKLL